METPSYCSVGLTKEGYPIPEGHRNVYRCVFCGKEMLARSGYEEYERWEEEYCNCKDAKEWAGVNGKIQMLKKQIKELEQDFNMSHKTLTVEDAF